MNSFIALTDGDLIKLYFTTSWQEWLRAPLFITWHSRLKRFILQINNRDFHFMFEASTINLTGQENIENQNFHFCRENGRSNTFCYNFSPTPKNALLAAYPQEINIVI